ncbi:MAG: NADH-quinone oxidoreductase subunit N [Solirubrobacterales bacterium]|nr:NADH-quinone oxidoreductase subunit N [Solirubrobacterales bacterium]
MTDLLAAAKSPEIDYQALAPVLATAGGALVVLLASLFAGRFVQRALVPALTIGALAVAIVFCVVNWPGETEPVVAGALAMDTLTLLVTVLCCIGGIVAVVLALRDGAVETAGPGEYHTLLLASVAGMTVLASAENLVTLFVGLELLSIPLYVLCAASVRDRRSLESGLKYLVIGSVGSATLLYGLAFVYGATASTDLGSIAAAIGDTVAVGDPLLLAGLGLVVVGLAFKASVAPFHQWTPDVYQGAPTAVTAFMAVTTKVAALAVTIRLTAHAFGGLEAEWAPALAALATVTVIVGNVGALTQRSLKRILGWSGVAQAGYMLAGVVVGTELGLQATMFYLSAYLAMNVAAFAVVVARERVSEHGDDIESLRDLGRAAPLLAWPMTIAMLALAGFPATAGFIGKFYLIDAVVAGDYAWLGIVIVVGSMISLGYYLRVVAAMWMGRGEVTVGDPPRTVRAAEGWSPEADPRAQPEVVAVAVIAAAVTVALGIVPSPLFDVVRDLAAGFPGLG